MKHDVSGEFDVVWTNFSSFSSFLPTWSMYAIERHFREYERGTQSACESKSFLLDGTSATRHTPVIRTQVRFSG